MDILFKREQSNNQSGKVNFKLWGKVELDDDEQEIVKRYKFDQAILIDVDQAGLLRKAIMIGLAVAVAVVVLLNSMGTMGLLVAAAAGIGAGYFWHDKNRESIFVKDLLHGRHFACDSVVELARKEAWLGYVVSFLRQVMESAKHWDGTERSNVEPLPPEEARQVIIRGL